MADTLISSVTVDTFREFLQQAGYRAEAITIQEDAPALRSATSGLPFDVRFNNRLAGDAAAFADVTLLAGLRVQGELPLSVVNDWNNARRFARLRLLQSHLLLDMDISVVGGVAPAHLRMQLEIWDRLIQDLITHLRETLRNLPGAATAELPQEQETSAA